MLPTPPAPPAPPSAPPPPPSSQAASGAAPPPRSVPAPSMPPPAPAATQASKVAPPPTSAVAPPPPRAAPAAETAQAQPAPTAPPAPPVPEQPEDVYGPIVTEDGEPAVTNVPATVDAQVQTAMVSPQPGVPGTGLLEQAAREQGFLGLDFTAYGVFPVISLDPRSNQFKTTENETLGPAFYAYLLSGRPKFLYKTALDQNDPRSEVFYSFDQQVTTTGQPVRDVIAKWAKDGIGYHMKAYVDAIVKLCADNRLMILQVPPTSNTRLTHHFATIAGNSMRMAEQVTLVTQGQEVTNAKFPFIPLDFKLYVPS